MKLSDTDWRGNPRTISISDAVEIVCENSAYSGGQLEAVERKAETTAKLLGRLVETLHSNGALSNDDVIRVLDSYRFGVVE